jgi:hypothetical protein
MTAQTEALKEAEKVDRLLTEIGALVTSYRQAVARRPNDWGYRGSLGHVREQLQNIRAFLKSGEDE